MHVMAMHGTHVMQCQTVNVRTPSVGVGRVQSGVHASSSDTSPNDVPARAAAGLLGWVKTITPNPSFSTHTPQSRAQKTRPIYDAASKMM